MDCSSTDRVKSAGTAVGEKVPAILDAISRASANTISGLKTTLKPRSLDHAVSLLGGAGTTCIIGSGDAFPAAALLANGLNERGRVCNVFGPRVGAAEQEISLLGPDDLLVLIKLPEDGLAENFLTDARACKAPVLVIAESAACPESAYCNVSLLVPGTEVFGTPILAGYMTVAQLLLLALDRRRSATC